MLLKFLIQEDEGYLNGYQIGIARKKPSFTAYNNNTLWKTCECLPVCGMLLGKFLKNVG